jgi:hypothetical protein
MPENVRMQVEIFFKHSKYVSELYKQEKISITDGFIDSIKVMIHSVYDDNKSSKLIESLDVLFPKINS